MVRHLAVDGVEIETDGFRFHEPDGPYTPERVNAEFDAFVMPAANWLSDYYHPLLPRYTEKLKRLNIPCLLIGVGAQLVGWGDEGTPTNRVRTPNRRLPPCHASA